MAMVRLNKLARIQTNKLDTHFWDMGQNAKPGSILRRLGNAFADQYLSLRQIA